MGFLSAPERTFTCTQWVDRPVEEVFAFFSSETNLERITPAWLGFHVIGKSTPEIEAGTLIDYRLVLSGIPMRWRTRIEAWEPGRMFVDVQLKGPYHKWHHTHLFEEERGGTKMSDRVVYQLPLGRVGDLLASWKVRRQVEAIFAHRKQTIESLFPVR